MFWAGAVVPSALNAQFRSAPRSFGAAPVRMGRNFVSVRPMVAPPRMVRGFAPVRPMHGAARTVQLRPGPFWYPRSGFGWSGFHHHRRLLFIQPFLLPNYSYYAPFYPYQWPPLGYDYNQDEQAAQQDKAAEIAAQQSNLVASQLQALKDEVEALRQEQTVRSYSPPPSARSQAAAQDHTVPAVLVYRDGHQVQATNYAIFGQAVWVFGEQTSKKIPLADLNLAMTRKLNEERGIDFALPN